MRGGAHFVDRTIECRLVGAGRLGKAAELAHELQRRGADLFFGRRRLEIEQRSDTAAHDALSTYELDAATGSWPAAAAGCRRAMASAISTVRRAISACSRSTMRPSIW